MGGLKKKPKKKRKKTVPISNIMYNGNKYMFEISFVQEMAAFCFDLEMPSAEVLQRGAAYYLESVGLSREAIWRELRRVWHRDTVNVEVLVGWMAVNNPPSASSSPAPTVSLFCFSQAE